MNASTSGISFRSSRANRCDMQPLTMSFSPQLINRHVFVIVLQRLSILCDLDGIRIENANRYMFAAEFYRPIYWRDPAFEGGTSAVVADRYFHIGSLKWPNSDAILFA